MIPFTPIQELEYLKSLSEREGVFLVEINKEAIGFQSLELWSRAVNSFDHIGSIGTFLLPKWRRKGIGYSLANYTFKFARYHGYEKIIAYVRSGNLQAIKFYQNLGFNIQGILKKQVKINHAYEDEVFMELFL